MPTDERGPGKAAFVPFVLAGERIEGSIIEERPGFARARADKILESSPARVTPHCPYFMACGGCHYRHISYELQFEIKAGILKKNFGGLQGIDLMVKLKINLSLRW